MPRSLQSVAAPFRLPVAAAMLAFAGPLAAEPLPRPEEIATAAERPLIRLLLEGMSEPDARGRPGDLAKLDALLAKLPEPTAFRGLVQFARSGVLAAAEQMGPAREAALESIRLLPRSSAPLFHAAMLHLYDDQAGPAADYLIRASRIDADILKRIDRYTAENLFRRLREVNDHRRGQALSERLLETGWNEGGATMTSSLAMDAIERRMATGDTAGASALVTKLVSPAAFATLLTLEKYKPLWPAVEAWAGLRLEKQWPVYLDQARDEWEASRNLEAGKSYAAALSVAGHDRTLIATFLPLFAGPFDKEAHQDLVFIAPPLANALARLGRWDEAYRVFDTALATWTVEEGANALNLAANRARLLGAQGRFAEAAAAFDRALDGAGRWGGQVNVGAVAAMHGGRACALIMLGRGEEAAPSVALVTGRKLVDPISYLWLQLCRGDEAGARDTLLDALAAEDTRDAAVGWMQPTDDQTLDSDHARMMAERGRRLRTDQALLRAVRKYGRVRPEPVNAAAPAEIVPTPG